MLIQLPAHSHVVGGVDGAQSELDGTLVAVLQPDALPARDIQRHLGPPDRLGVYVHFSGHAGDRRAGRDHGESTGLAIRTLSGRGDGGDASW